MKKYIQTFCAKNWEWINFAVKTKMPKTKKDQVLIWDSQYRFLNLFTFLFQGEIESQR